LRKYLDIELSLNKKQKIAEAVTFSSMKKDSAGHLQKGRYGKWVEGLNDNQKELARKKVGPMLELLNYPLREYEEPQLPDIPETVDQEKLQEIIKGIKWQGLFV
jgi:hypothetical protein